MENLNEWDENIFNDYDKDINDLKELDNENIFDNYDNELVVSSLV
jgi:hypothetical protein